MKLEYFYTIALFITLNSFGQSRLDSVDIISISMLKTFYSEYNNVWLKKPPIPVDKLDIKLDSLMKIYCTSKLRTEANNNRGDYDPDIITKGSPAIHLFEKFKVVKDHSKKNTFIVQYITSDFDATGKYVKRNVKFNVTVVKVGLTYKVSSVL